MFTMSEAIHFIQEGNFKHANLIVVHNEEYQVWSDNDSGFTFRAPDGEFKPMGGDFKERLGERGNGWFVSALREDEWRWHFSPGASVHLTNTFNFGSWLRKVIFRTSA